MYFHSFNIGYIDIPNTITLNIYTVGCPHKCNGCHASDLQDINHKDRQILTSELIHSKLVNCKEFYQGICWLGGDPLYQFEDFIKINQQLKYFNKDLLITCFTGYTYLDFNIEKQFDLLSCVDILIDGPWQGKVLSDPETNQKIWINNKIEFNQINYNDLKNKNYKI